MYVGNLGWKIRGMCGIVFSVHSRAMPPRISEELDSQEDLKKNLLREVDAIYAAEKVFLKRLERL